MIEKTYAHIVEHDGQAWLIGGHWSEPVYTKKPQNLYALTTQREFDTDSTLAIYVKAIEQVGWYVFPDGEYPKKTPVLAQLMISQVQQRSDIDLPFTAVLNLGRYAWLIILDAAGNILPGWERWGKFDDIVGFLNEPSNAADINSFRANTYFEPDEHAAWTWLLDGFDERLIAAQRLQANVRVIRQMLLTSTALLAVLGGGHFVLDLIHSHQRAVQLAQLEALRASQSTQASTEAASLAKERSQLNVQLNAYWTHYPRPWQNATPERVILAACQSAIEGAAQEIAGWARVSVTCSVTGRAMTVAEFWKRGPLATVLDLPPGGQIDPGGDSASTTMSTDFQDGTGGGGGTLTLVSSQSASLLWLGSHQKYAPEIKITIPPRYEEFRPPVPAFVPQDQVQMAEAETPVLWRQAAVSLQSLVAPWGGWPMISTPGFEISQISVNFSKLGMQWTLRGDQYAR